MLNNSYKLTFSFLINAKKIVESEKDNFDEIFKERYYHWQRAKDYSKNISKRIYNDLENHLYTFKDILVFMLYKYAFGEKIKIYQINYKEIQKILKVFTKKQLKIDEDFIVSINKNLKLKSVDEFFEMRENGEPIIYELIKKNYVTPVVFVKFCKQILTHENKDVILNIEYKRFEKAMLTIIKTIKGGLDE